MGILGVVHFRTLVTLTLRRVTKVRKWTRAGNIVVAVSPTCVFDVDQYWLMAILSVNCGLSLHDC